MKKIGKSILKAKIFIPPKYGYISEKIKLDTEWNAKESGEWLREEFEETKTLAKKLRLMRATRLAQSRAEVMSKNRNYSGIERHEFAQIALIYEDTYTWMKVRYYRIKQGSNKDLVGYYKNVRF